MKKFFWGVILAMTASFAASTAIASNITVSDGKTTTAGWYGSQEDGEVEPGNVQSQVWDLEAFVLKQSSLSVIGGYNFKNGQDSMRYGDIFIDTNGNAQYGTGLTDPVSGNGLNNVANSFGYDFVFDLDFTTKTKNAQGEYVYAYTVYSLTSSSTVTTSYYSQNATSNPWRYSSGGTKVEGAGGFFSFAEYKTDSALKNGGFDYGLTGAESKKDPLKHYVISGFDLSFLGADVQFLAHTTMECGNDNLIGKGTTPVPEPGTMLLFGTGVTGLAGIIARRRKISSRIDY